MDTRRLLILALAGLGLSGCAVFRDARPPAPAAAIAAPVSPPLVAEASGLDRSPEKDDAPPAFDDGSIPYESVALAPDALSLSPVREPRTSSGPRPNAAAQEDEGAAVDGDAVVGEVQVFGWAPGRVYPVRTAPLRVTTLTLGPGETLVSKAAGDTVRWQIGETTSGEGADQRAHVLIKPLQRGLATNLVLTTSRRVYLVDLTSGGASSFNPAVAWDAGALEPARGAVSERPDEVRVPDPVAAPEGPLDARYRIEPQGRRARWTPASVFNDGLRTFIAFDPDLQIDEAPALFVIAPDGEAQMVNYRQAGGLFIVDRVFDRAELRLGDRRRQVVRIRRLQGAVR